MSTLVFERARIVDPSRSLDAVGTAIVKDGLIAAAGPEALNQGRPAGAEVIDCAGKALLPGLVDMRVFIGEPGAEHRETIASASTAAAAGGVTSLLMMPDTEPAIDDVALVEFVMRTVRRPIPLVAVFIPTDPRAGWISTRCTSSTAQDSVTSAPGWTCSADAVKERTPTALVGRPNTSTSRNPM